MYDGVTIRNDVTMMVPEKENIEMCQFFYFSEINKKKHCLLLLSLCVCAFCSGLNDLYSDAVISLGWTHNGDY